MLRKLLRICLLLCAPGAQAADLCESACKLSISFPEGGSIATTEALEFRFGDGGLVDTGDAIIAYVSGDSLSMAPNEILHFAAGGQFILGDAGNVDFIHLLILTSGVMRLEPATDSDHIDIPSGSLLEMSHDSTLEIAGLRYWDGLLIAGNLVFLNPTAPDISPPVDPGCLSSSGLTLTVGGNSGSGTLTLLNWSAPPTPPASSGPTVSGYTRLAANSDGCSLVPFTSFAQLSLGGSVVATNDVESMLYLLSQLDDETQKQLDVEQSGSNSFDLRMAGILVLLWLFAYLRNRPVIAARLRHSRGWR